MTVRVQKGFLLSVFLCSSEEPGRKSHQHRCHVGGGIQKDAIDIVSSMAGSSKINSVRASCWERTILVLPALKRWEASVFPFSCCQREGWYFCATPWWLVISFEDDLEKKGAHMVAPTFCVKRDDGIAVCCCRMCFEGYEMHLVTETELQRWLLTQPKAIPCTEIQAYKYKHKFCCLSLVTTKGICKRVSSMPVWSWISVVVTIWCIHLARWTRQLFHTSPSAGHLSTWHNHHPSLSPFRC